MPVSFSRVVGVPHQTMPLYCAEAIVIRTWRYAEADLIASCYSRELGKIRGIAKGARKMRSRFGSSMQPFNHIMLQLYSREGEALYRITNVDVLHSFFSLAGEWERLQRGARLVGLVDLVTPEAERNDELFTLLLEALHLLAGASEPARVTTLLAIKLLALAGYEPELERCVECGKPTDGGQVAFSPSGGGIVCGPCAQGRQEALSLSRGALQFLRRSLILSLQKGLRLRLGKQMQEEVRRVLVAAYAAAVGESPRLLHLLDVVGAQTERGGDRSSGKGGRTKSARAARQVRPPTAGHSDRNGR